MALLDVVGVDAVEELEIAVEELGRPQPLQRREEGLYLGLVLWSTERGVFMGELFIFKVTGFFSKPVSFLHRLWQFAQSILIHIPRFLEILDGLAIGVEFHVLGGGLRKPALAIVLLEKEVALSIGLSLHIFKPVLSHLFFELLELLYKVSKRSFDLLIL